MRERFLLPHTAHIYSVSLPILLPLEFREMLLLVCFPEVLKTLAVINVDSSLKSKENILNLESLNQVFRAQAVAWVVLLFFFLYIYIFLLPSEFPKCFVIVYAIL